MQWAGPRLFSQQREQGGSVASSIASQRWTLQADSQAARGDQHTWFTMQPTTPFCPWRLLNLSPSSGRRVWRISTCSKAEVQVESAAELHDAGQAATSCCPRVQDTSTSPHWQRQSFMATDKEHANAAASDKCLQATDDTLQLQMWSCTTRQAAQQCGEGPMPNCAPSSSIRTPVQPRSSRPAL